MARGKKAFKPTAGEIVPDGIPTVSVDAAGKETIEHLTPRKSNPPHPSFIASDSAAPLPELLPVLEEAAAGPSNPSPAPPPPKAHKVQR